MGTAASSRWFMGPCVHFGLRGRPVLVQMDGIKPPQHDACCWCCHFIHPHIKSHLHSIGCFSGAWNAIKGNGEGRPNSSRKPSSPAEEPSSCPARFRIARVRLCHFSTASVPAATRRQHGGAPMAHREGVKNKAQVLCILRIMHSSLRCRAKSLLELPDRAGCYHRQ
jgi:hypothetical protein